MVTSNNIRSSFSLISRVLLFKVCHFFSTTIANRNLPGLALNEFTAKQFMSRNSLFFMSCTKFSLIFNRPLSKYFPVKKKMLFIFQCIDETEVSPS